MCNLKSVPKYQAGATSKTKSPLIIQFTQINGLVNTMFALYLDKNVTKTRTYLNCLVIALQIGLKLKFRDKEQVKRCRDKRKGKHFTGHVGLNSVASCYVYTVAKCLLKLIIIGIHLNSGLHLNHQKRFL